MPKAYIAKTKLILNQTKNFHTPKEKYIKVENKGFKIGDYI
jgi:hypothetical protein